MAGVTSAYAAPFPTERGGLILAMLHSIPARQIRFVEQLFWFLSPELGTLLTDNQAIFCL
ncbi:hypothetical protein GCM10022405_24520 [Gibbsiella dentisursi]|uniref:Transposase n=1 Tax=Gibbsiella dentisursi TaxID=796890 RepID=A0ABP7LG76_9GAMM